MAKSPRTRERDHRLQYTHRAFRPYAIAMGQLALAWNGFHQALAFLFCTVMGGGNVAPYLAVWNAIRNDRSQRAMLLAATKADISTLLPWCPELLSDLEWVLKNANTVEDTRDDALHSPLSLVRHSNRVEVVPAIGLGSPRAIRLTTRHILTEYRWCRDMSITLRQFISEMDDFFCSDGKPWPDRPKLPNRGQTSPQKRHRPTGQAKPPPPP